MKTERTPDPRKIILMGLLIVLAGGGALALPPGNIYGLLLWMLSAAFGLLAILEANGI